MSIGNLRTVELVQTLCASYGTEYMKPPISLQSNIDIRKPCMHGSSQA